MENQFDDILSCVDPTYLEHNRYEAARFAAANLRVESVNFIQALHIKGALGHKVPIAILKKAFELGKHDPAREEVIFYLSRVSVPEMDENLINLLNLEIHNPNLDSGGFYWLISALMMCNTSRGKLFLKGLVNKNLQATDPIVELAINDAKKYLTT